jgi:DNA modification methylase
MMEHQMSLDDYLNFNKAAQKEDPKENMENEERISGSKAMQITELSRHSFDKAVKEGLLAVHGDGKKKYYLMDEIQNFMATDRYRELSEGVVDPRNSLNDLTGKEWLPETKSFFYQKGLGADSPEAQIEKLHPAPYSFQDIGHLVRFFTKAGMNVLDPFGGVGSTAKACEVNGRFCTSIELSPKWHALSIQRLETEVGEGTSQKHRFINGDSCEELLKLENESFDFVVTSPPYWGILNKLDQKVKKERVANNLETKYSDDEKDLGNVENYDEFLDILVNKVFLQCARVLRTKRYMALVVSDFRDKGDFISFHSDLIQHLNRASIPGGGVLRLKGTKILLQNHKSLLPYGYPFAYVENIHHQYILIFQKEKK